MQSGEFYEPDGMAAMKGTSEWKGSRSSGSGSSMFVQAFVAKRVSLDPLVRSFSDSADSSGTHPLSAEPRF